MKKSILERKLKMKITKYNFIRYFKIEKKLLWSYFMFLILSSILSICIPLVLKYVIDEIIPKRDLNFLYISIFALFVILVFYAIIEGSLVFVKSKFFSKNNFSIRKALINKIINSKNNQVKQKSSSFYIQALINDVIQSQVLIYDVLLRIVVEGITFIVLLFILLNINIKLTLIYFCFFPLYFIVYYFSSKRLYFLNKSYLKYRDLFTKNIDAIYNNLLIVKRFKEKKSFATNSIENARFIYKWSYEKGRFNGILKCVNTIIQSILILILIFIGAKDIIMGQISLGTFVVFYMYSFRFFSPINNILQLSVSYKENRASIERLEDIIKYDIETDDRNFKMYKGNIELKNLTLSIQNKTLIENINFIFERNKFNFIIGENGAGKTTLVNILNRNIPVECGKVFLDNVDINNISIKKLREKVSINHQKGMFISDYVNDHLNLYQSLNNKKYNKNKHDLSLSTLNENN
jgi:ABC-type bacteriocin/lantibiotic exporter with double-glycine peptidase domain